MACPCLAPSHFLNHCWLVVHWNIKNKFQWIRIKLQPFNWRKWVWKNRLQNDDHLTLTSMCCVSGNLIVVPPLSSLFSLQYRAITALYMPLKNAVTLQWRHNGRDSVSNHESHDFLLNRYSDADQRKHQSSTSLAFVGKSPGTGEFPAQMASYAENVSIWWRHHDTAAKRSSAKDWPGFNVCGSTVFHPGLAVLGAGKQWSNEQLSQTNNDFYVLPGIQDHTIYLWQMDAFLLQGDRLYVLNDSWRVSLLLISCF